MAYTPYTPVTTGAPPLADIDLPDDSELETSGVGAFDAPLQDLADRIAGVHARVARDGFNVALFGTVGGFTIDSWLDSVVTHTVQFGGVDAIVTIAGVTDDMLRITATFGAFAFTCDTQVCLRVTYGAVSEVVYGLTLIANMYTPVTLHGYHEMTANDTAVITMEVTNSAPGAGVGVYIYPQLYMAIERSRL